MNRHLSPIKRMVLLTIYGAMICGILWQALVLYHSWQRHQKISVSRPCIVKIDGAISHPGYYEVPEGTTTFEILKVAGVTTFSNLSLINLAAQVAPNQSIKVDSLARPISEKPNPRLELFFGSFTIIGTDGTDRAPQEGMSIDVGDRILTEEKGQVELSVGSLSTIALDNYSELSFSRLDVDSAQQKIIQLNQKNGIGWYKIALIDNKEVYKITAPLGQVSIAGKGADFTIEVQYSQTVICVNDGLLLLERPDGTDAINVIARQSVTIYNDGRPFAVSQYSQENGVTSNFNQLAKTKADIARKQQPFNFLFISPPFSFILVSVQFDGAAVKIVQLPPSTSVATFVQGFSSLQESLLYGGPVFTSTFVERILNVRIPKHMIIDKEDIIKIAASIGGAKLEIDAKAASHLNLKAGPQTLKGDDLIDYLNPSISGFEDSQKRQVAVLKSLFEQLVSKNIVLTSLLADQILTNIETNISTPEIMANYTNVLSRKNWSFKNYELPCQSTNNEKGICEPDLTESRKLLFQ